MKLKRHSKKRYLNPKAVRFSDKGRAAEKVGDFRTASIWYKKAAKAYGRSPRGRMWLARSKDLLTEGKEMGTLFQGNNKLYGEGPGTIPKRGKRRIGKRHKRRSNYALSKR